jgi:hypothetical protein
VNGQSFVVQIPAAEINDFLSQNIETGCGAHPAPLVGAVGDYSGVKQVLVKLTNHFQVVTVFRISAAVPKTLYSFTAC